MTALLCRHSERSDAWPRTKRWQLATAFNDRSCLPAILDSYCASAFGSGFAGGFLGKLGVTLSWCTLVFRSFPCPTPRPSLISQRP
jgi:hypothetical protein